jgi:hypothetical protein
MTHREEECQIQQLTRGRIEQQRYQRSNPGGDFDAEYNTRDVGLGGNRFRSDWELDGDWLDMARQSERSRGRGFTALQAGTLDPHSGRHTENRPILRLKAN